MDERYVFTTGSVVALDTTRAEEAIDYIRRATALQHDNLYIVKPHKSGEIAIDVIGQPRLKSDEAPLVIAGFGIGGLTPRRFEATFIDDVFTVVSGGPIMFDDATNRFAYVALASFVSDAHQLELREVVAPLLPK